MIDHDAKDFFCDHRYVSNSGQGGLPHFRAEPSLGDKQVMPVKCYKCCHRSWMNSEQWEIHLHIRTKDA